MCIRDRPVDDCPDSFTRPRHRRLGGSRSTTMPTTGEGGEQDSLHQPAALTGRVARTTCTWTMATVRGSGGHAVEHQRCQLGVRLRVGPVSYTHLTLPTLLRV